MALSSQFLQHALALVAQRAQLFQKVPGRLRLEMVSALTAAEQIVGRYAVILTYAADESQSRLPRAVLVMAQQSLADTQVCRHLPLAHPARAAQAGQCLMKRSLHSFPLFC